MKISIMAAALAFLGGAAPQQQIDLPAEDLDNAHIHKYELTGTEEEFRFPSLHSVQADQKWNYDKHGSDWDIESCNVTTQIQSPMNFTRQNETNDQGAVLTNYYDWVSFQFSFVPYFHESPIKKAGVNNLVFNITLTDDTKTKGFNGFYASEPFKASATYVQHQVQWQIDSIVFHYPAEHLFNNTRYDMEMQIYTKDYQGFAQNCVSKTSFLSVFFTKDDKGADSNGFFAFQKQKTGKQSLDLSLLLNPASGMLTYIDGYIGTLTQPPCTKGVCWYLYEDPFKITDDELNYFKVDGVDANYRQNNLVAYTLYKQNYYQQGLLKKDE